MGEGARAGEHRTAAPVLLGVSLKLYMDVPRTLDWARALATIARERAAVRDGRVRLFVLPSLPAIPGVVEALRGSRVEVGAQDLHWADRGAFTGAVSGADLVWSGCGLVEVGHAERRLLFGEDEGIVRSKVAAAVRNGLTPVLCVGETERLPAAEATRVCIRQVTSALEGLDDVGPTAIVVAYEPVWAIGRPEPAAAAHVLALVGALRDYLSNESRILVASVIYGGSARRGQLRDLGAGVDGLFLGRSAHDPEDLALIIDEAAGPRELIRR